jgi:aminobenzoyl-glutamate transport protein
MQNFLNTLEHYGNKIPHPSLMFFWLCIAMIATSAIAQLLQLHAINPVSTEAVVAKSLLSAEGLRFMLTKMVKNFTGFAPLGIVLVAMLGIGIAEKSGLMGQILRSVVGFAKGWILTFIIAFTGVMSSLAADSGYVVLVPLSALIFIAAGRSPLAGIATAFAAVSGGYSANLLIGPIDAILAGVSTEAVHIVDAKAEVSVTANWYFNIFSTFFIAVLVTLITEYRKWPVPANTNTTDFANSSDEQTLKGLGLFTLLFVGIGLALVLPESAPLRDPDTGSIAKSPFIRSIVVIIALYFAGAGLVYGFINKTFSNGAAVIKAMEGTMASMAGYMVLMFFAAQFIAYFNWSNIGLIIAIEGANLLSGTALNKYLLLIAFILISAFINLFIGSSSAKWVLIAPVFIPMLMLLGIQPELTQLAYRIGDSSTNIITPMMPYFALVLAFAQQHDKKTGMGTLLAAMLPYSIAFLILWSSLFILWLAAGIPVGI